MKLGLAVPPASVFGRDFLAVGEISLDEVAVVERFPQPDQKVSIAAPARCPGGQAATAAVGCARLGWRASFIGAVGDDDAGRAVTHALMSDGVDVHIVVRAGAATRTAIVIVERATGRRTVMAARDARLDLAESDVPSAEFTSARVVLVDGSDLALATRAAAAARSAGARTMIDVERPGPGVDELLRLIDVIIAPADFFLAVTGEPILGAALAAAATRAGAVAAVATLGSEGAVAWCGSGEVRMAACPVEVVDTTGAGDGFRVGFASAWLAAGDAPELEDLLRVAAQVGALNCRAVGAQTALPRQGDLDLGSWPGCNRSAP